ncbi:MAG TPA: orotidine-5'-phosphate decarboxylase [Pirellulales bacterium]|nr:orotidine-5'-phosphate decarboxylase [Pirellulales bacterium]
MTETVDQVRVTGFGDLLAAAVTRAGSPVVVGLDPRWQELPDKLKEGSNGDFSARSNAYVRFCREIIDVVKDRVALVKPQVAFFEQLGPPGMQALGEMIRYARECGLIVIADGKRNDIGSTAEAYADAWMGANSAWQADALTVSPYLGSDSLAPFVLTAHERGAGLFVLAKTSNPGGGQFQDLDSGGRPLYRHVADHIEQLAAASAGSSGYGSVGAVVGATYPGQLGELRAALPHAWLLVPGFGSQGGSSHDVAPAFDARGLGAVINNSRGIIFAYRRREYAHLKGGRWQDAVAQATDDMIASLHADTAAGRLRA